MKIKKIIKWSIFLLLIIYIVWKLASAKNEPAAKIKTINSSEEKAKVEEAKYKVNEATYTCSMHPEIIIDEPGDCPKCGRKLIPKTD